MRARAELHHDPKRFDARVRVSAPHGEVLFSEWRFDMEIAGTGR